MEVRVSKCENGHYYDVNRYSSCPHCGAGEFAATAPHKNIFGFLKKNPAKAAVNKTQSIKFANEPVAQSKPLTCEDVQTAGVYTGGKLQVEDVQTQGLFAANAQPAAPEITEVPVAPAAPVVTEVAQEDVVTTGFFAAPEAEPVAEQKQSDLTTGFFAASAAPTEPEESLLSQVKAATDDNDVKTTGFFAVKNTAVETKGADIVLQEQPPVGWLVCVAGQHLGKDFRIFAGKNAIGRTEENAVCLSGESSVSREKHAWVIFEPRKQEFFLKPGDGSALVYLNGENVFDTTALRSGDLLELGEVKMVFVALCGQNFNWETYINKE